MNLAEALLAVDAGKIKERATKEIEIPRLSKLMGEPFVIQLRQIPTKRMQEIQDMALTLDKNGKLEKVNTNEMQLMMICDGIENKEFDNRDVLKRFGAATRKDLFQTLFNAGEISGIYKKVSDLCGYGDEAVKDKVDEVKN